MTLDELLPVTLGSVENPGDRGAVIDRIMALKLEGLNTYPRPGVDADTLSVDTPVPLAFTSCGSTYIVRCDQLTLNGTGSLNRRTLGVRTRSSD